MKHQEIAFGEVTYEVCRVYSGDHTMTELLLKRLTQNPKSNPSFDETHTDIL